MNFCVKLLSIFLVLVMLASTVVSCAFQPNSNPPTQGGTTTNNGITVLPPNNDDNKEDINNGNHVGGVVVGNVTAPYIGDVHVSAGVTPDENNQVPSEGVSLESATASATIPGGVQMEEGANELALTINGIKDSSANVELSDTDVSTSLDVHVSGVAAGNIVPMEVKLLAAALKGLNSTSITLYHVENGETIEMTYVPNDAPFTAHNQFKYDPVTGDVTLYIASFSEIAIVSDTDNAWEGNFDYSWYDANAKELYIANADQLAAFGAIVGGMKKVLEERDENGNYTYSDDFFPQDSFSGKTVKLIADINLGDKESENNEDVIFYPIGYWNNEGTYERKPLEDRLTAVSSGFYTFEGTFDGNGHTIANFYQNTWEMKGDHDWYNTITEQYFRDGMGLFGRLYKATVKNLTVKNFSSDGEITTTGVIAAYADGATFENIAVFNCNPRVYNIGNGGIVGCVGWYAKEANLKTTFKNITVDNSNKISALWGSYDVACGGIVGQYYPTSGQTSANKPANGGISFENCHVSAVMDVYNDVCANYQYYAYRYTGMLIGSVRENETIDGHVYPKMDGITASGCTVHFGTWNDYYYCEIIDNTTASYTHDYQMSRLTEIKAINGTTITYLDGTTGTVPASGRANYVIVDYTKGHGTENATCYHFKDGEVWNHEDAGYHDGENGEKFIDENGDGIADLKEDKQHIYLEFNNLVTGYGWGVTTKYVGDLAGVSILDREYANSVDKFEVIGTGNALKPSTEDTIQIGTLFGAKVQTEVDICDKNVIVFVTPLGENSTVRGTYAINEDDWTQGTLALSGVGLARVTITDYYFCNPTSVIIDVQPVDKFTSKLTGDFLYRVGNQNTIALGLLFEQIVGKPEIDDATVEVILSNGNIALNTTDWTKGTIDFKDYTGIATITIKDDSSNTCSITVEVVNGKNITSNEGTTSGGTFILLCNINTNTYVNYWNCTFYGNGFTYTLNGAPTSYNSKQGHGIIITKNTTLDNLVIIGDIYNSYGAYTNQDYYNAAIDAVGDTIIQNCYISNCAAPVLSRGNNLTIENSTLYGGTVANLIIKSGTVTLNNVITANYDDGRPLVGMGIVIHSDATDSAKLILNGTLTQYNFINESKQPSDTYAQNLHSAMFGTNCNKYHFGTSPNRYVNAGIISMTDIFNSEDIIDNANTGYEETSITLGGKNGFVYTQPNSKGTVNNNYSTSTDPNYSKVQGAVPPSYEFDYENKNYQEKQEGSNDYCYQENGKVYISMDEGDSFKWDTSILTVIKAGITLPYNVKMNNIDYTGKSITFDTAGEYTVTYTYTDSNNFTLDNEGNLSTYSKTYVKTVHIIVSVIEAATKHAEFTFGSNNTESKVITIGNTNYVMPNVTATSTTIGSTTVNGTTIYYPIVEIIMSDGKTSHTSGWYAYFPVFSGAVTIKDYADHGTSDTSITYNGSTTTMPNNLSVVGEPSSLFKYQSGSTAGSTPVVKNNKLVYSSPKIEAKRSEYNTVIQYSYTDNAGTTYYYYIGYHAPAQSYSNICVTPDTLVTLADGSQKRIDAVTYDDMLLVWNFYTGQYTVAPAALIQKHGYAWNTIIKLTFSDGTVTKAINEHGYFDATLNEFVMIRPENAADYIGHEFVKEDGNSYTTVTLTNVEVSTEYIEAYSILTAYYYNFITDRMFSLTSPVIETNFFMPFVVGENMTFNADKMAEDIAEYGLYEYADFEGKIPYEVFEGLNIKYLKVAVGKGLITYDQIVELLISEGIVE